MKHDPDSIFWEARYEDGSVLRQPDGHYKDIDRDKLAVFALVYEDRDLLAVSMSEDFRARFFWRRRTRRTLGGSSTVHFLVGFGPTGPIHVLDTDTGQVHTGMDQHSHDIVDFSMPSVHLHEGEAW